MQQASIRFKTAFDFGDGLANVFRIREIDLDMVFGASRPWAVFGEVLSLARDHAPALAGKAFDGCMADASAGAREHKRFPGIFVGHGKFSCCGSHKS